MTKEVQIIGAEMKLLDYEPNRQRLFDLRYEPKKTITAIEVSQITFLFLTMMSRGGGYKKESVMDYLKKNKLLKHFKKIK